MAPSRHGTARRTRAREISFASKLEADALERLWAQAEAADPSWTVVRQPQLDLFGLWHPGMGKPLKWTPDALVLKPTFLAAPPSPLRGSWEHQAGRYPLAWRVEVHEAKTARGLESRDYVLRLAAWRAEFPWVPVYIWRRARGELRMEPLGPLKARRSGAEAGE